MPIQLLPYQALGPVRGFLLLVVVLFLCYACVALWAAQPWVATIAIALPLAIFLRYVRSYKLLFVALIAALIGTTHEAFFASHGYWVYGVSTWESIPAYLLSVWAAIGLLSAALYKGLLLTGWQYPFAERQPSIPVASALTLSTFGLVFAGIWHLATEPWLLVGCFIAIEIVYVALMRNPLLTLVGCFTMAAGMLADLYFVSQGVWSYPESSAAWYSIPVYIFAYWHIMGALLAGLYASLDAGSSQPEKTSKEPGSAN